MKKEEIDQNKKNDPSTDGHEEKKKKTKDKTIKLRESEYKHLQTELAEYKNKCIRIYADFENTRKRLERDKIEFVKYANEGIITEFLNILDDLERSVDAASVQHQDYDAFLKGVEMVMARVYEMLKKNDVKPIEALGKKFDPHCHEILTSIETDEYEDGSVMEEFQKGYFLSDRVIRTSKVKVAVKKNANE